METYGQVDARGRETGANEDAWLVHYNTERPHQGYRNRGRRPIETIELFLSQDVRNVS
jgi:hypothetical protein